MKYYTWVERSPKLTPFGPNHDTPQNAIDWAKEWGGMLTPEHTAIFLIFTDTERRMVDIYRSYPNQPPLTLGELLW